MDRVGVIGLGTMGVAMAANVRAKGFETTVWNRTPGRSAALVETGAAEAGSPANVARDSDVVLLSVSDTPDVEAVLFGPGGVEEGAHAGLVVVDTSTISPSATRTFAERLRARGADLVDAPVSGGSEGARNATLTVFVGGEEASVERVRPVLEAIGRTITHFGPVGSGQAVKAVNQVVIAGTYLGVAEGLVLAMKAGLDPDKVVAALGGGVAGSWILQNRSARMIANDYPLGFRISLHLKDLGIALGLAREVGAALPVAGLAQQLENGLVGRGYGDEDNSDLARAIRELSGLG
ncbi:MAG TPA: NAD(P)-dependent oxidoreductase [Candidatus Limnocylindrales bacterium]|nr:NAD(P)-dependent oxidoreductase [Candidatus Limnocylindrales bacterium]